MDSIHRGVWYTCNLCEYNTKWKRPFKTHIESVHGNVQLWSVWLQGTIQSESQSTRTDSVHGDVQYSCDHCDYKATRKGDLKTHI